MSSSLESKLSILPKDNLKEFALKYNINVNGTAKEIRESIANKQVNESELNAYIKKCYQKEYEERKKIEPTLIKELNKVERINWVVVQGQLDDKIQREYVRVHTNLEALKQSIQATLTDSIEGYVIASWYNHWTTAIIGLR